MTPPKSCYPFVGAGEPYSRFFVTAPTFRGPGRDSSEVDGLETVKIGVLLPFAGLDRELGLRFRAGVDLAIAEANATGGYRGLPFEALHRDEAEAWGAAANAAGRAGHRTCRLGVGGSCRRYQQPCPEPGAAQARGAGRQYLGHRSDPDRARDTVDDPSTPRRPPERLSSGPEDLPGGRAREGRGLSRQ